MPLGLAGALEIAAPADVSDRELARPHRIGRSVFPGHSKSITPARPLGTVSASLGRSNGHLDPASALLTRSRWPLEPALALLGRWNWPLDLARTHGGARINRPNLLGPIGTLGVTPHSASEQHEPSTQPLEFGPDRLRYGARIGHSSSLGTAGALDHTAARNRREQEVKLA